MKAGAGAGSGSGSGYERQYHRTFISYFLLLVPTFKALCFHFNYKAYRVAELIVDSLLPYRMKLVLYSLFHIQEFPLCLR